MPEPSQQHDNELNHPTPDTPRPDTSPLECVLGFIRVLEAGGGAAGIRPFLADSFVLVEAPHLLAPEGSTRTLSDVLAGADQSPNVVADKKFLIRRTTCEGGRVAVEADWSATVRMDLRYWDRGETIRARTSSVFEVRDGLIVSQDSYDCYYR
jgi:limonene-1,2-epoxide hydrolase